MAKTFSRLSRPLIKKLPRGEKISEHGITFERLADGDGIYTVNIMVDGKRIHRVIGRESDGTTRTQAEEFIGKTRQDAKASRLNLPKGRKIALGFEEAVQKYLLKLEQEGGKNIKMKETHLRMHLTPFFGKVPLSQISTFDIERYKKYRASQDALRVTKYKTVSRGTKTKPATINRELATLSHLFNKAVEWGWIDFKKIKIKRLKADNGRIVYLTTDQVNRLLAAAREDQNIQIYPFILVGLETSMRKNEILSIRREHLDLQRRVIYIPKAKAGAREQPITRQLADFLASYVNTLQSGTPWLFPSPAARSGHTVDLNKPFRRCVERAGLDPKQVIRHTLRHTAITHLVQAGVDLPTVKRISGHKTLAMVERYSHQNGAHIENAMDKLEQRYRQNS